MYFFGLKDDPKGLEKKNKIKEAKKKSRKPHMMEGTDFPP